MAAGSGSPSGGSALEGAGQGRLTRAFFARPVLEVAPQLLGCTVSHAGVTVRLTEVEAYDGSNDPGSHAFRGQTPRTRVMFGEPGGLYVYFTYGMHWCANLVCGSAGAASAVLMRAGEVVEGLELARTRRAGVIDRDLARGPARLAMTLALTRDQNGIDTTATDSPLVLRGAVPGRLPGRLPGSLPGQPPGANVLSGPRVGVSGPGGDATAYPWRFWLEGEATVSVYRPGKVRPPKPAVRSCDP
ncbi:MAG TPA: DNA-3-methyladenine glycosylase [Dermatophilaceae bacterium]|nr:DNA-3-methyladenine glycosylase [Dermatophilaceae bacterium]